MLFYRSDSKSTGRELNNGNRVAYQYPVYTKPSSKEDHQKVEVLPAVGEVIQSRFQGKPFFEYGKIPPKNEASATFAPAKPPTASPVRQAPAPVPPSNSFPAVFNVPPVTTKPPVDLYTSPYSSYNPPPLQPNSDGSDSDSVPIADSYALPPSSDGNGPYNYNPQPQIFAAPTFGPPLSLDYSQNGKDTDDTASKSVDAPPSVYSAQYQDDGPPDHPPKSIDDIYYPPGVPHDDAPQSPDNGMDHPKDLGSYSAPIVEHGVHFPHYLYSDPHLDHHIYDEIPHTTTPAPEQKRVSSSHYSYYYLGRKLWYIPLYFSIYFMIYVTVLILKAIARHKVEFKHDWLGNHQGRSAREMTYDKLQAIDDLHRNVTEAVDKVSKSYADMAMK